MNQAERESKDALVEVMEVIRESREKYVLGILLDMAGAFINAW